MDKELEKRLDEIEKKLDEILLRLPYYYTATWPPYPQTEWDYTSKPNAVYPPESTAIDYGHEPDP